MREAFFLAFFCIVLLLVLFSDGSRGSGGGECASRHVSETEECEGVVFT